MIAAGMCDALVSDGAPATLARAALRLARRGRLPIAGAWSLISSRPARVLGLSDRGKLLPGQRADLVVLHRATGRIAATMAAGRWVYRDPELAPALAPRGYEPQQRTSQPLASRA